ncbi:restriction endonuclease subunit S [Parapedobacter sp. SGR-10]|uniref:restriction endonuclease subunit S n=1 Tax=Parapedobacter sp. SGR-10 TaxID=2710879 RepID=UPI0013D6EC96|nr:restriction endonuclease subunit S [Parapedobacter sp. SGR-10]NGF55357.1 restriction endonuclease subunit S [Parapedobacter sp. SGR-10]
MSEWKEISLEKVAEVNPTERLPKGTLAKKIAMEILQPFTKKIVSYTIEEYSGGTKFRNGDTIVARITPSLENGKTAFVDILDEDEIAFGSTEFIVLREKAGESDKQFLYYLSISPDFRDVAILSMTGSSGRQRVQTDVVKQHLFLLPPLPEQRAIASVLSSLDDKIDLLHRQNATLEKMAETLFRQWFVEEESELIPLGECIKTTSGGTPSRKRMDFYEGGNYQWVKSKELNGGYILDTEERITVEALKRSSAKLLPENSVLIAMYGATVGQFAIIGQEATCNQAICACLPNDEFPYTFIYHTIKANVDELKSRAVGSAQQNISQVLIKSLEISVNENIEKFHAEVDPMMKKIKSNYTQIRTLTALRDTLLPKLMSGEVRVEEAKKYKAWANFNSI